MGMAERNLRRELGKHLTGMDNICFQVEHPRRRMAICSLWIFQHRLDTTLVMAALENLCIHHPRFCLVPKHGSPLETGIWSLPQQHWKFRDNFIFHTLTNPTLTCLQDYVATQYVKPFDPSKPLWEAHLITGLENNQCAFLWKIHHGMSDELGILKALLATTTSMDPKEEMYRQWQQQQQQQKQRYSEGKTKNNNNKGGNSYSSTTYRHHMARQKYQQLQYETAKRKFGILWQQLMMWLLWGWALLGIGRQQVSFELWTLKFLMTPWIYQCKHLLLLPFRLLFIHKKQQQQQPRRSWYYDGDQTIEKRMAWTDDLNLGDIQSVQRILGNYNNNDTFDDVILLVLGRTMQQYSLQQQQQQQQQLETDTFHILLPVRFRHTMDWTMKNATATTGSILELHMGKQHSNSHSTWDILNTIHQYRRSLQRSLTSTLIYYIFIERVLRYFPFLMAPQWIQQWYTDLPHASMASLKGPSTLVFFGGQEMKECYMLPTQSGKGSITVGVLSYGDKVNLSILTDNHPAYPDLANTLCKIFVSEFNQVVDEAMAMANGSSDEGRLM